MADGQRMYVLDIDPDYRRHDHRDSNTFCYCCGKSLKGKKIGCTIRLVNGNGTEGDMLSADHPPVEGEMIFPIGSDCVKCVPADFRCDVSLQSSQSAP